MTTSQTSSLLTGLHAAHVVSGFHDELQKIAEATNTPAPPKKGEAFKKALKNVGLASLGAAAGTGAAMLGHEVLKQTMGARYEKWMPSTKLKIVAPLLGLSSMALIGATMALQREMAKPPPVKTLEAPKPNV